MTYMSHSTGYCISSCISGCTSPISPVNSYRPVISNLEAAVETNRYHHPQPITHHLQPTTHYQQPNGAYAFNPASDYSAPQPIHTPSPEPFLKPNRPASPFVGSISDIAHYIQQAFTAVTGGILPNDVLMEIVTREELKQRHEKVGGAWSPGIQGFSVNKQGFGTSSIVVKENELDKLMITIGHEIGHIMTFTLNNQHDEEAKAFAFEMAWIDALVEHNIANLAASINPNPMPAMNGLHDVAFMFVQKQMKQKGKNPLEIFRELSKGKLTINYAM